MALSSIRSRSLAAAARRVLAPVSCGAAAGQMRIRASTAQHASLARAALAAPALCGGPIFVEFLRLAHNLLRPPPAAGLAHEDPAGESAARKAAAASAIAVRQARRQLLQRSERGCAHRSARREAPWCLRAWLARWLWNGSGGSPDVRLQSLAGHATAHGRACTPRSHERGVARCLDFGVPGCPRHPCLGGLRRLVSWRG